jgi:hypothetical protein
MSHCEDGAFINPTETVIIHYQACCPEYKTPSCTMSPLLLGSFLLARKGCE